MDSLRSEDSVDSVMAKLTVLFACVSGVITATNNNLGNLLFKSNDFEFFDLTHPFDENTIYWPDAQSFVFTKKVRSDDYDNWYASNDVAAGEHGGTHMDAPFHFLKTGKHVGDIPLEKLIVPLIVADFSMIVNGDPNFVLHKHHFDYILDDNIGEPYVMVFKFGWSQYFNNRTKYLGLDEHDGKLNFPGLSVEVVEWLTSSRSKIVGIGVDVASIDPGSSEDFPAHKASALAGLYNIENVNLNVKIPEHGCVALVMPMKIAKGTGAPLRFVAICPKKTPANF